MIQNKIFEYKYIQYIVENEKSQDKDFVEFCDENH